MTKSAELSLNQDLTTHKNANTRMRSLLRPLGALSGTVLMAVVFALVPVKPAFGVIRYGVNGSPIDPANLGKGGWILNPITDPDSTFGAMKSQGFNYVIVKAARADTIWTGSTYVPVSNPVGAMFTNALVQTAHAHGLLIFGSNRTGGDSVPWTIDPTEITNEVAVADFVFNQGADGFIWDAESTWESSNTGLGANGPTYAWWLASMVRQHWPTNFLALNCADTLWLHSSLPYQQFAYWSDCIMPMVYHHSASQGNPFAAILWTDVNYQKWQNQITNSSSVMNGQTYYWSNSIKPLVLMRDTYADTSDQSVRDFIDYTVADPTFVTTGGYQGFDGFRSELFTAGQIAYMQASTISSFSNVVNNIVMDDAWASMSSPGTWTLVKTMDASTSTVNFYGSGGQRTNSFGTNFFCRVLNNSGAYMQFTPNILTAGDYNVYQWHPTTNSTSTNVPFVINYNGGSTTIHADQTTNAGNWSLLGKFNFAAGTAGYIRVTDSVTDPAGNVALVDGVKLAFVGSVTKLGSSANPSVYGDSVTLTATVAVAGGPATGTITFMDGATTLGTAALDTSARATFITNNLSATGSPHSLTAVYGGDSNFPASTSSAVSQTITAKSLTASLTGTASKVYDGTIAATLAATNVFAAGRAERGHRQPQQSGQRKLRHQTRRHRQDRQCDGFGDFRAVCGQLHLVRHLGFRPHRHDQPDQPDGDSGRQHQGL